jgi:hypothetical protein
MSSSSVAAGRTVCASLINVVVKPQKTDPKWYNSIGGETQNEKQKIA